MQQPLQTYTNGLLTAPIYVNGILMTDPKITIARIPYLLERYEFEKIIKVESFWLTLAQILLGTTIGLFLNMAAKYFGSMLSLTSNFECWEVIAFLISLVLMGICYGINCLVPNEKRRIENKIKQYFKTNYNE